MAAAPLYPLAAMSFSHRVIALRRERALTQQGLADATGIHVQQIKRYEAGTAQPSAEALKKFAKAFAVTTDWLLFEEGERGPDDDLRLQFEAVSQFDEQEKELARGVLEGLILKHQAKQSMLRQATPPSTPKPRHTTAAAKGKKASRERARA
jgi:transcriptional regulator with XRE-family HTH domain